MVWKILVILALTAIGATQANAEHYAVLMTGDTPDTSAPGIKTWFGETRDILGEFWHDTFLMWEALYTFGWKNENIFVLFGYGEDWDVGWYRYDS